MSPDAARIAMLRDLINGVRQGGVILSEQGASDLRAFLDRIGQLTAELAEARETIAHCDKLGALREERLREERAAHERTKADAEEAIVMRARERDLAYQQRDEARRDRDAAQAKLASAEARARGWKECAKMWRSERDASRGANEMMAADLLAAMRQVRRLSDELLDVESRAAALRLAMDPVFEEYLGRGDEPVSMDEAFVVFRDTKAGDALAARLPLLEAVATKARHIAEDAYETDDVQALVIDPGFIRELRERLAALDEKGGG